eukprot:5128191-Pyramimonas_sp.AAC.1
MSACLGKNGPVFVPGNICLGKNGGVHPLLLKRYRASARANSVTNGRKEHRTEGVQSRYSIDRK